MAGQPGVVIVIAFITVAALISTSRSIGLDFSNPTKYIQQLQLLSVHCQTTSTAANACPANSECNIENTCECKHGFHIADDKNTCQVRLPQNIDGSDPYDLPSRQLAKSCNGTNVDNERECGANAFCYHITKICICNPGYKPGTEFKVCKNVNSINNEGIKFHFKGVIFLSGLLVILFCNVGLIG